jgi:hypothetical protein
LVGVDVADVVDVVDGASISSWVMYRAVDVDVDPAAVRRPTVTAKPVVELARSIRMAAVRDLEREVILTSLVRSIKNNEK